MFILFISFNAFATNYYVDNTASGSNDGTSWTDAWQSFGDISWGSLGAGDTLWISGGSSGQTYTEELNVQASGDATADLVIRAGLDANHNGTVTVNKNNHSTGYGFNITNQKYITIQSITFTESRYGGLIRGSAGAKSVVDITLDSITITQFGDDSETGASGYGIEINGYGNNDYNYIDSVTITNSLIQIIDSLHSQTDGIQAKFVKNFYMDNTTVYIDNREYVLYATEPQHNDAVQFFGSVPNIGAYNITIINSRLITVTGVDSSLYVNNTLHSQNVQTHDLGGTIILYNNTIEAPYSFGYLNVIYDRAVESGDEQWVIVHNTITTRSSTRLIYNYNDDIVLKNNIFYADTLPNGGNQFSTGSYAVSVNLNLGVVDYNQIDGNLYSTYAYQSGTSDVIYVSSDRTMAYVNSQGGETSGTYTNRDRVDPLFTQYTSTWLRDGTGGTWDLHLQAGSPAIDEGADLQTYIESLGLIWEDKDGVARDSTPDIGAYQYQSSWTNRKKLFLK